MVSAKLVLSEFHAVPVGGRFSAIPQLSIPDLRVKVLQGELCQNRSNHWKGEDARLDRRTP